MRTDFVTAIPKFAYFLGSSLILISGWGLSWNHQGTAHGEPPSTVGEDRGTLDLKLDQLTFFEQRWLCNTEGAIASDALEDSKDTMPYQWEMVRGLNDLWFFARAYHPPKTTYEFETWGYNTLLEKYGRTIVGNDGKFANFLSGGWQDDTLTWQGSSANMVEQTTGRHQIIITRTSDRSYTEVEQKSTGDNTWTTLSTKTCTLPDQP